MSNTKIVTIKGGLGNQLFQYAYGLKASLIDKKDVIFDTSFFTDNTKDINRPFLLNMFNINPRAKFQKTQTSKSSKLIKKIISKITGDYGYYQGEQYFIEAKDEVLKQFTLKYPLGKSAQDIANHMDKKTSVSVHIRRGDYVNNPHTNSVHGICNLEYYYRALDHIKSKVKDPHFFIFSDDIEWAKNNLNIHNTIFVSNGDISEVEEMILMSMCAHNIIANSTFSWWAAYLNKNNHKTVIAPKQWTRKSSSDKLNILPKSWIQL